jgi:hypothetical protein
MQANRDSLPRRRVYFQHVTTKISPPFGLHGCIWGRMLGGPWKGRTGEQNGKNMYSQAGRLLKPGNRKTFRFYYGIDRGSPSADWQLAMALAHAHVPAFQIERAVTESKRCGSKKGPKLDKEIRAGRLRAVKAGRLTRIPASERERYISQLPPLNLPAA